MSISIFFILIAEYKDKRYSADYNKNIVEQTFENCESNIGDNYYIVDSVNYMKDLLNDYGRVMIFSNVKNKGIGAANNQGFEYGLKNGADYFFLLNQDAWIENSCLKELVEISQKNKEYGIVSPLHLNGKGDALDFNFSNYISPHACPGLYSDFVLGLEQKKVYEARFVNAAAWLLPIKCLELVGGFSPAFFHYGEDDNYCHRVLFHQLKIGIFPFARIYHDRENRTGKTGGSKQREWTLKYSNPLSDYCLTDEIKYLRRNLLKNKLMRRKESVRNDLEELTFLEVTAPKLWQHKKESQLSERFKFLNI